MTSRPGSRATHPRRGPSLAIIGGAALVLIVAVVIAVALTGSDSGTDTGEKPLEYGTVSVTGDPLAPLPDSGADPAVGVAGPTLTGTAPDGSVVVAEPTADGGPSVLVFLAHWCPHCRAELPLLVELAGEGVFSDVRTTAVLTATDPARPNYPPSAWLDDVGWAGVRLYDDAVATAARAYGVTKFPFMVFLDADGAVVSRLTGEQPAETVIAAVAGLTS